MSDSNKKRPNTDSDPAASKKGKLEASNNTKNEEIEVLDAGSDDSDEVDVDDEDMSGDDDEEGDEDDDVDPNIVYMTCTEGKNNNFFEMALNGTEVITRAGKIGNEGVSGSKEFATEEKARAYFEKTVDDKIAKGFVIEEAEDEFMDEEQVTVKTLQEFLAEYVDVLDNIEEIDDLKHDVLCSAEFFCEHINSDNFCGWNFTKYPVYKMFDNGSCEFFAGIVNLDAAGGNIDKCPIYMFDLSCVTSPPRFVGNFKTYMTIVLKAYTSHPDAECKQRAKQMIKTLNEMFSSKIVMPEHPIVPADFGL